MVIALNGSTKLLNGSDSGFIATAPDFTVDDFAVEEPAFGDTATTTTSLGRLGRSGCTTAAPDFAASFNFSES
jgi:hypothetical protein